MPSTVARRKAAPHGRGASPTSLRSPWLRASSQPAPIILGRVVLTCMLVGSPLRAAALPVTNADALRTRRRWAVVLVLGGLLAVALALGYYQIRRAPER